MKIEPCRDEWWQDEFGNWRTTKPTMWEINTVDTVDAVEGGTER